MTTDVETRLLLSRQVKMEPKTEEIDNSIKLAELPNLVQCGTIEDLLHDIAPQQPPPGPSQCWEEAWSQVLEALDAKSLPHVQSCGSEGNEGVHSSQKYLKEEDALEEHVSDSSLSLSLENMWMLQFQLGDDIESCLESFEQAAKAHRWSKEEWIAHLKPHLSPKAFLACCNVAGDYSVVKASILRHHGITPEIQWRCFRQYRYHKSREGPREAYRKLRALAWRWLKDLTKEQVLEQLVLEQFLAILPQDMQSWVRRCSPKTCARAVDLAEGFQLGKKPPVSFKDVSVKFSDAEWTLLSEKQRTLYQDTMLEIFQNVSSLGFPREKHEFIAQVKKGGELDFQDDAERGYLLESELKGNSLLPVSKEYYMETKNISKTVKKPAEKTQEHSGQVQSFGNEPSSPETQPVSQSPTKVPSVKTQPTKRQTSSPKGRKHQKKEQQPPTPEEPASKRKQSPPSLPKEEPHNQELSDYAISIHKQEPKDAAISTPKSRKRKKGTPPQSEPPKKKKQAVPIGKHFKMKKKSNTQEEPHELQEGLPVPEKTFPHKKSQRQQEAQQAPSPDENAKPRKVTTSGVTWHPPFSATVASDLTCLECGRSFKQRADLRHHQYVHTREKPYACTMCSKCFRHPSHLHIHQRTHSGERPYKCPECGKTFSQSCNLRTHRQIHTGKKPFQCSVCSKCFYHRSNLTIHKRVHTGERPYSCSVCPKSFSDRSTLVQHERTHTGERPYACLVCKQRFSQMSHLTKHSRVHSDARGQPKMEPTGVLAPSSPKNCMSQLNGKDDSFKKTEAKQGQNNLTLISKTLVSSSSKDRLPQNKDAT